MKTIHTDYLFLVLSNMGSQIKEKRWFFTGQVSNLCNSLPKGVEVSILCDLKGRLEKFLGVESTEGP